MADLVTLTAGKVNQTNMHTLATLPQAAAAGVVTQNVRGDLPIAAGATATFGAGEALLIYLYETGGGVALIGIDGAGAGGGANNPGTVIWSVGTATWSGVKDNPGTINVYVFGGIVTIQNNEAGAIGLDGWILRAR